MTKPWPRFLLIYAIVLVIITPFVGLSLDMYKETFTSSLRILHLVLFNHDKGAYDQMQSSTRPFYQKLASQVDTYYYCFSPTLQQPFVFDNASRILYIQGDESYAPGALDKTIKVFHYFEDTLNHYDYVVRSNISTLVDFEQLMPTLESTPIEYGGGLINQLSWLDDRSGVKDETYFGTKYVSGTCIIFSTNCLRNLLQKSYMMNYNLVDDLAIGVFIARHLPEVGDPVPLDGFLFVPNLERDESKIEKWMEELTKAPVHTKPIFYRNHNGDRALDADQIRILTNLL